MHACIGNRFLRDAVASALPVPRQSLSHWTRSLKRGYVSPKGQYRRARENLLPFGLHSHVMVIQLMQFFGGLLFFTAQREGAEGAGTLLENPRQVDVVGVVLRCVSMQVSGYGFWSSC